MAEKKFGGSKYFTLGALWWFVIGGVMGILHLIFPSLVETPLVVILAVLVALAGSFAIVYFARTK
jgi:hypothetical protein